jgi:hypothetical protein
MFLSCESDIVVVSPPARGCTSSLEFGNPLQRGASQSLGITRDVTLPFSPDAGHASIERGNKLAQVVDESLIRSGFHAVLNENCGFPMPRRAGRSQCRGFNERCAIHDGRELETVAAAYVVESRGRCSNQDRRVLFCGGSQPQPRHRRRRSRTAQRCCRFGVHWGTALLPRLRYTPRMQLEQVKLTFAASWLSVVCAAGLVGGLTSLRSWAVLIGVSLLPSVVMMRHWNHPGRSLSESIQEARQ